MTKPSGSSVLIGVIGAAQGLRGEVRVKSFTENPRALANYGVLFDASGQRFEILSARMVKTALILRFLGVNNRDQAESLNGTELFIDRSALADEALEEDEFFLIDLEGLKAHDSKGGYWGVVSAIFDFGGGDLLELRMDGRKPMMIPFTVAAVPEIDIEAGRILVDPVAAGLMDDMGEGDSCPPRKSGEDNSRSDRA